MCVTMKPRRTKEAQAHIGLSSHTKKMASNVKYSNYHYFLYLHAVVSCIKGNFLCEFGGFSQRCGWGYDSASLLNRFPTFRVKHSRTLHPWRWRKYISSKRRVTITELAKLECLGWNLRPVELVKIYNMGSNANLILPLQVFALPIVSVEQIKTVSRGVCCNLMHVVMLTSRGAQVSAGILRDIRNWGTR